MELAVFRECIATDGASRNSRAFPAFASPRAGVRRRAAMHCIARHLNRAAMAIAVSCVLVPATVVISVPPAMAQHVAISAEFRSALEPYGEFRRHPRWGEVWS